MRRSLPRLEIEARAICATSPILDVNFTFRCGPLEKNLRGQLQKYTLTDEEANAAPGSKQAFYKDRPYCLKNPHKFSTDFKELIRTITNDQLIKLRTKWPELDLYMFKKAIEIAKEHKKPSVVGFHPDDYYHFIALTTFPYSKN